MPGEQIRWVKNWRGSSGSNSDIAGVENVGTAGNPSSSSFRGDVNTAAIVSHASVSSDSAADYCNDMNYGGYTDWYLPSKSEMAYIYCHSDVSSHSATKPDEDVNCGTYGGKTSELTGFFSQSYWTSTEGGFSAFANIISFDDGTQNTLASKSFWYRVRCARRY